MFKGYVCGHGATIITTPAGVDFVKEKGLTPLVMDPAATQLHLRPAPIGNKS